MQKTTFIVLTDNRVNFLSLYYGWNYYSWNACNGPLDSRWMPSWCYYSKQKCLCGTTGCNSPPSHLSIQTRSVLGECIALWGERKQVVLCGRSWRVCKWNSRKHVYEESRVNREQQQGYCWISSLCMSSDSHIRQHHRIKCNVAQCIDSCKKQLSARLMISSADTFITLNGFGNNMQEIVGSEEVTAKALMTARPFTLTYAVCI